MNATNRLIVGAAVILVFHGGMLWIKKQVSPSEVRMPERDIHEIPLQLGGWRGEAQEMNEYAFKNLRAKAAVNRSYRRGNDGVSFHVSMFDDYDEGLFHEPPNCYRANGWRLVNAGKMKLDVPGKPEIEAALLTWEGKDQKTVRVLFWYELGDEVVRDRKALGAVRWGLLGTPVWPALVKVLLQVDDTAQGEAHLKEVAERTVAWMRTGKALLVSEIEAEKAKTEAAKAAKPDAVRAPERNVEQLPLKLGRWVGAQLAMGERLLEAVHAKAMINRRYFSSDHDVALHVSVFDDYDDGLFQKPPDMYRVAGFRLLASEKLKLDVPGSPAVEAVTMTWEGKDGRKVRMLYWYEVGDRVVLSREDLGAVRANAGGGAPAPAMVKFQFQTAEGPGAAARLKEIAEHAASWLRTGKARPGGE